MTDFSQFGPENIGPIRRRLIRSSMQLATTRLGGQFFTRVMPRIDLALAWLSNGRLVLSGLGAPILILSTAGRRSYKIRRTPPLYLVDHGHPIIIGSRGGRIGHPAWYLNLQANPDVHFTINGVTTACHASITDAKTHTRLWPIFTHYNPGFVTYQNRLQRQIPIVKLIPNADLNKPDEQPNVQRAH